MRNSPQISDCQKIQLVYERKPECPLIRSILYNQVLMVGFILLPMLAFAGCAKEDAKKIDLTQTITIKDTLESNQVIRIGIIPDQNIRTSTHQYEPLVDYLNRKMNLKVTLVYLNSYSEACDKFIYKQLDAAFIGSFNYVLTHMKVGVEPVARPESSGGVSVYRGLVLVQTGSGIQKVSDMKGKRLALVHPTTFSGSLYPLYYFKQNGVTDMETFFSDVFFTESHDKAILTLLNNGADVAIAKDQVYRRMIKENPDLVKKLTVLSMSEPVPTNTLCVRKELDPAFKEKLRKILCNLDQDVDARPVFEALGDTSKFVEARDEDYRVIYSMAKELGIDLSAYPYRERFNMSSSKDK